MAYSEKAKQLRRCEWIKADGQRCRNYSRLDSNVCGFHLHYPAIKHPKGRERGDAVMRRLKIKTGLLPWPKNRKNVCRCYAYNWPHRAGGGFCRWPDEPLRRLSTPSGAKSGKGKIKDIARAAGVKMRGVTDSINYERQGDVEDIKEAPSKGTSRGESLRLEDLLRKVKGGGHRPDW